MNTPIYNNIKNLRELKNYTQQYVAERLGITQAGYNKIEKGKTALTYKKLLEISEILEVHVQDTISLDSKNHFKHLNIKPLNNNNGNQINIHHEETKKRLYEDKIILLEKLLTRTDYELEQYKQRYGSIRHT